MKTIIESIKKYALFPRYLKIRDSIRSEKCILLVGTSSYNNMGDHLLSFNSLEFLKTYFPEKTVIEVPTQIFKRYGNELAKVINKEAMVCISAGGWMGNLWVEDEMCMQRMLKAFSKNRIYILPQTVFYDESLDNCNCILEQANSCYRECSDLTLFVREANSFSAAKQLLDIRKIILAPDMGLFGEKNRRTNNTLHRALFCLREDKESVSVDNVKNDIVSYLTQRNISVGYFDTIEKRNISVSKRKQYIDKLKRKLTEKADLVITDRLHGMIFAVICGCKCLALDNKNHKVSGVYESWLSTNPNIVMVTDKGHINKSILDKMLNPYSDKQQWYEMIDSEFEKMARIMKGQDV